MVVGNDSTLPILDEKFIIKKNFTLILFQIPVRNNRELTIFLVIRDASGQVFDNASSLDIKWSSSNTDLVKITQKHSQSARIKDNFSASGKSYKFLLCIISLLWYTSNNITHNA